jgi:PAS domain-containing protein
MEARKLVLDASHSDSPVVIIDAHHRVEWVNDVFTRITGCAPAEVAGSPAETILCGERADAVQVEQLAEKLHRGEWFSI